MSSFIEKLCENITKAEGFTLSTQKLFSSYVLSMTDKKELMDKESIKKLIFSSQIFLRSDDKKLQNEGKILLSMMLDLYTNEYPDIVPIASSIFMEYGDFPNLSLLSKRNPKIRFQRTFYSEAKSEFRESLNTVEELNFPLTDFQRSLWEELISDEDVITSAPTSAGKTHIILNYLISRVASSTHGAFVAIIVPTRALISEVAGKIYEISREYKNLVSNIEICTVPKEGAFLEKTFFVMTQERLHEVLLRGDISFDYLFIDEAQNIVENNRGVLLHLTIDKILENSIPQIIISMPSASYQNSFTTIFDDTEFAKKITEYSPVSKVIMEVITQGHNLKISRANSSNEVTIKKGFSGAKLADIVYKFGKNHSNIIYRNRTDYCEDLADAIAELIPNQSDSELLEEAADYIQQFIHTDFSLAKNLRKGVAFHYGPLPSSVRTMIVVVN